MVTSTSTSTFLDTTTDLAATGSPWSVQGPCEAIGACVQSPNYPENYGDRQSCNLSLPKPSVVTILDFLTEPDMDFLTLHGIPFSGLGPGKKTFTLWTNISWRSDPSVAERGWKICLDPPPFCDDGLPLTPIAVRDCPPGSTVLPTCEEAAPGELCEADGQCGTRTDVNNCCWLEVSYRLLSTRTDSERIRTLVILSRLSYSWILFHRGIAQVMIRLTPIQPPGMCIGSSMAQPPALPPKRRPR